MRGRAALILLAASSALKCGSAAPTPAASAAPKYRAPYEAPAAGRHAIDIRVESRAAHDLFAFLTRPTFDAEEAKAIEALPAVRLSVQDSGRTLETFDHDLAAAFDEKARSGVFDLHPIRAGRARWEGLLGGSAARRPIGLRTAAGPPVFRSRRPRRPSDRR